MADSKRLSLYRTLLQDVGVLTGAKSSLFSIVKCFFGRAGFQAVVLYRLAASSRRKGILGRICARFFVRLNIFFNACDIDADSLIGPGLKIPHPCGIVIGLCTIGHHAMILQNVTIGMRRFDDDEHDKASYPTVGDHVVVSSGAALLGGITIGNHVTIGANSVVLRDVPDGCTAIGAPAIIAGRNKETNL